MEQHLIADIPVKALIVQDSKVLITKDKHWELPGGRINVGETLEDALHREINEELGVEVTIQGLQDVFVLAERNPPHVIVVYRCERIDQDPFKIDPGEIGEMRWISKDDDLSVIDFFPGYVEMLKKFFTQYYGT